MYTAERITSIKVFVDNRDIHVTECRHNYVVYKVASSQNCCVVNIFASVIEIIINLAF